MSLHQGPFSFGVWGTSTRSSEVIQLLHISCGWRALQKHEYRFLFNWGLGSQGHQEETHAFLVILSKVVEKVPIENFNPLSTQKHFVENGPKGGFLLAPRKHPSPGHCVNHRRHLEPLREGRQQLPGWGGAGGPPSKAAPTRPWTSSHRRQKLTWRSEGAVGHYKGLGCHIPNTGPPSAWQPWAPVTPALCWTLERALLLEWSW